MPKQSQEFLDRVRLEARGKLDPSLTQAVLDEVAAHLDAAIQARMEMGDTQEEAEMKAVAEFGTAEILVKGLLPVSKGSWFDTRFFARTSLASVAFFTAGYFGWHWGIRPDVMSWVLTALVVVLFGITGYETVRARRIQLLPLVALFALISLLGAMGQARVALPGEASIERAAAISAVQNLRAVGEMKRERALEYDHMHSLFLHGASLAPDSVAAKGVDDFTFVVAPRDAGARMWKFWDGRWRSRVDASIRGALSEADDLQSRLDRPWLLDTFGWLAVSASSTFYAAATLLAFHLMVLAAGAAVRLGRRSRRTA